ncbi:hypothetical protein FQN57_006034 [Myotisia sp. PD_48]|nr:hypothetical protein FQN57_006034 [Myotisia sp. PD_48]
MCRKDVSDLKRLEIDRLSSPLKLAAASDYFSASASSSLASKISTGRPSENYGFSCREHELERLHQALSGSESSLPCAVINGIGGVGKTQLALAYTYNRRYSSGYDAIFWVRAETSMDVTRSFNLIADKLQSIMTPKSNRESSPIREPGNHFSHSIEWFETTSSRWLLIFDNVDDPQSIRAYIPRCANWGSIIITTQIPKLYQLTKVWIPLQLTSFDHEDSLQLILKTIGKDGEDVTEEDRDHAGQISEFVGGLPLAITIVCGYITSSMMSLHEALSGLQMSDSLWANESNPYEVDDQESILGYKVILFPENPDESLRLFANKAEYHQVLKSLNSRQLIRRHNQGGETPYLSLHRILQSTILHILAQNQEKRSVAFRQALGLVQIQLPQPSHTQVSQPDEWHKYELYVPQVLSLRKRALWPAPELLLPLNFANILIEMGTFMWHTGLWYDARTALETATQILERNPHQKSNILISDIDDVLGIIDDLIGVSQREDSFRRRHRVLRLRKIELDSVPEPKRTRTHKIRLYNAATNLGCAYLQDENFEEAGKIFENCLEQYRSWTLDEEEIPFEYAKYYNHMAFVYMSRGRHIEAIRMSRHACKLLELHHKGPDAPLVQFYRFQLGNHLYHAGELDKALQINLDCLRDRIRIFSDRNAWTLDSYMMTGVLLFEAGQLEEARTHLEKCFEICKQFTWSEEGIAMAHFRYARILTGLEQHQEAKEHFAKAEDTRNRFLNSYAKYLARPAIKSAAEIHDQMIPIWIPPEAPDQRQHNLTFEEGEQTIVQNVRGRTDKFSLDRNGFVYVNHESKVPTFRFRDQQFLETTYLPECEQLILDHVDAVDQVFIFDWRVRDTDQTELKTKDIDYNNPVHPIGPASQVHVDQSEEAAIHRVRLHLPDQAEELLKGRLRIINIWRPIRGPVQQWPLAVCDGNTVHPHNLIETDHVRRQYAGCTLYALKDPGMKWYYMKNQRDDEVLLFKNFDSNENVTKYSPHSSFELEEVEDEQFQFHRGKSTKDNVLLQTDDEDEDYTDTESEISTDSFDGVEEETLYERLAALQDMIPPQSRHRVSSTFSSLLSFAKSTVAFGGKSLWVLSTSAFLIGVPWALALAEEQQFVQMEREQGMIKGANEILTPGATSALTNPAPGEIQGQSQPAL